MMLKTNWILVLCLAAFSVYSLLLHMESDRREQYHLGRRLPVGEEEEEGDGDGDEFTFLSRLKEHENDRKCGGIFRSVSFDLPNQWHTSTCRRKQYTSDDLRSCLHRSNRSFALGGDSRMRQVYKTMLNLIYNQRDDTLYDAFHRDDFTNYSNTQIQFFWLKVADQITTNRVSSWLQMNPAQRPDVFIFGMGPWYLSYEATADAVTAATYLPAYKSAFQKLAPLLNELGKETSVIWFGQGPTDYLRYGMGRTLHTQEDYNSITEAIVNGTRVTYWYTSYDAAHLLHKQSRDGVHYSMNATDLFLDILLNFYCNSKLNLSEEYCCSSLEDTSRSKLPEYTLLINSYVFACCMLFLVTTSLVYLHSRKAEKPVPNTTFLTLALSILSFALVIILCYTLERFSVTHFEHKQYSIAIFCLPAGAILLLACFTSASGEQSSILNRDQTDEWKGWMQLVIVIYHVTGSSQELAIYMNLRFIMSSYLVLNGYGHFMFYIRSGSISFSRLFQVIVRMNLLCVLLCIVMKQPYQFYYFVPLVTFWYLLVCLTLSLPPKVTDESLKGSNYSYLLLLFKLLPTLCLITALDSSKPFFDAIFSIPYIRTLFSYTDGSLNIWRFRLSLDRFGVLFGIILAMATNAFSRAPFQVPRYLRAALGILAVCGLFVPISLGWLCDSKQTCNELHSFLFFIPIMSFIYLRNIAETVRQRHSWLMAWFGRNSLELFLLQFHLLMCNDAQKVLRVLPWPFLNEAFLVLILITASSIIQRATKTLLGMATSALSLHK